MSRIIATRQKTAPSLIYLRGGIERDPRALAKMVHDNLPNLADVLQVGAVAVQLVEDRLDLIRRGPGVYELLASSGQGRPSR